VDIINTSILIGLVSLALSIVGLLSGKFLNKQFGKVVEVIGGSVLIFIGLRIVVTHLMA
jgi:putative Mn2+ efflux pump MntP